MTVDIVRIMTDIESPPPIEELLRIMARLRDPDCGCPWDIEQDFKSVAPYTLEEAYEVADAIERQDMDGLKEELGDLLLQVVFHSQMAAEQRLFTFDDVVQAINHKLVSRHPHVFGDETAKNADDVLQIWNAAKEREKQNSDKKKSALPSSVLDDIPVNFPSLMRAQKISRRAAKLGFEWQRTEDVIDKIIEELNEFRAEIYSGNQDRQAEELGDVFFTIVNLGRRLDIDCDGAMRACNEKFYRRFSGMERDIKADGKAMKDLTPDEWEDYWQRQKKSEK